MREIILFWRLPIFTIKFILFTLKALKISIQDRKLKNYTLGDRSRQEASNGIVLPFSFLGKPKGVIFCSFRLCWGKVIPLEKKFLPLLAFGSKCLMMRVLERICLDCVREFLALSFHKWNWSNWSTKKKLLLFPSKLVGKFYDQIFFNKKKIFQSIFIKVIL